LPNRSGDRPPDGGVNTAPPGTEGYLLRSRSHHRPLPGPLVTDAHDPVLQDARLEPFLDQADDTPVADPVFHETDQPFLADFIEGSGDTLPVSAIIRIM